MEEARTWYHQIKVQISLTGSVLYLHQSQIQSVNSNHTIEMDRLESVV